MDADAAFSPYGPDTVIVGGTAAAGTARQVTGGASGLTSMLVWNSDTTNAAFLFWGVSAAAAVAAAAAAPAAGSPVSNCLPLPAGVIQSFTLPANYFYCVFGVGGQPAVHMVAGGGI